MKGHWLEKFRPDMREGCKGEKKRHKHLILIVIMPDGSNDKTYDAQKSLNVDCYGHRQPTLHWFDVKVLISEFIVAN